MLSIYVQNSRTMVPSPTLEPQERLAQNSEVINVNPQQNPCAQLLMLNVEMQLANFPFLELVKVSSIFFQCNSATS